MKKPVTNHTISFQVYDIKEKVKLRRQQKYQWFLGGDVGGEMNKQSTENF